MSHLTEIRASRRALTASDGGPAWRMMEQVNQLPQYDAERRPDGIINLSGASNKLMKDWMDDFVEKNAHKLPLNNMLSYTSISGGPRLLTTMASFFNSNFAPSFPILPEHILAANGVTSMIDLIAWSLCDPGEGIVYPTPTFYMLDFDLTLRSGVSTVPVSCSDITDPFNASYTNLLVQCLEGGIDRAVERGICCRVLFICNPANPQGRCYSKQTLLALRDLCVRRKMHLVADEIYAMSQFDSAVTLDRFTSVLSIDNNSRSLEFSNVHCLYGLSKDFDMGGLRMAFLVTRNGKIRDAMKRVTWFTWITKFSEALTETLMSQSSTVEDYLRLYRERLTEAYGRTRTALINNQIPFEEANSGLFVSINLSSWLRYFMAPGLHSGEPSREIQLCKYLIDHGVFLNCGEFARSDRPGQFRLVFTEGDTGVVVLAIEKIHRAIDMLEKGEKSGNDPYRSNLTPVAAESLMGSPWEKCSLRMKSGKPSALRRLIQWLNCLK